MKRFMLLFMACVLIFTFSACGFLQAKLPLSSEFSGANFNNSYWYTGDFWAFDNTLFYQKDGFYNIGTYRSVDGRNHKMFEESDFEKDDTVDYLGMGDIFVCDYFLYFELVLDDDYLLYRYDLKEETYTLVCKTSHLFRWVVVEDYFIYRGHPTADPQGNSALYVYNIKDGTTAEVCPDVEEFGVIDGRVRYITYTDGYSLYEYDYTENRSSVLGTFSADTDEKFDIYNFTPSSVVMLCWDEEYERELVVYTYATDSTAVYTLPKGIQRMVAFDRYAYAVLYDVHSQWTSDAIPSEENGIYRIDLTNGSYEVVEKTVDNQTEIHVASDDRFYIIQGETRFILYKRTVYKCDYSTKTKEKIAVL